MPTNPETMRLIFIHDAETIVANHLGNQLAHIYSCPKLDGIQFGGLYDDIYQFLIAQEDPRPNHISPFTETTNSSVVASIKAFFENWLGLDIEAKSFYQLCHHRSHQLQNGHKPVFITS